MKADASLKFNSPPSRESNPFATCWTRPGALPWCGACIEVEATTDRLAESHWRAQLVGPHGAGKSTLLRALEAPLRHAGKRPASIDAARWQSNEVTPDVDVLLVEGFELLSSRRRRDLLSRWRLGGFGYVVTTHRVVRAWRSPLPATEVRPDERLLAALFESLVRDRPTPVTLEDARWAFGLRRGDLREVWFDLYDRHERLTRRGRTTSQVIAYSRRPSGLEAGSQGCGLSKSPC